MSKNLVIVESPAKAKTIEKFLGKDYLVKSSYGHIRDLPKKGISVDIENNFTPKYEIPTDKKRIISDLKKASKEAGSVLLASDEDREGEAIAWHLCEALGISNKTTKRIVFHEITKSAIDNAIKNPRNIDINLVNAQQARRVLDRLVGYELSPVLWRKVRSGLSAGRVQSVAVRLIVEREREIKDFVSISSYKVKAYFQVQSSSFEATLSKTFENKKEAQEFLEKCKNAVFSINDIQSKPSYRNPAAPFTTSTLQQDAAKKLGFSVKQTMVLAQKLYESGHITYMRTDSTYLASSAVKSISDYIVKNYGEKYLKIRTYKTKHTNAQEAHEAIRPTDISKPSIHINDDHQSRLYELIWKKTVASQMSPADTKKTELHITNSNSTEKFIAKGEILVFDGFYKVYGSTKQDLILPDVKIGEKLTLQSAIATESFTKPPARYSEATLVRKLEELGIGRPSTYSPTISTIQDRGYVEKRDLEGQNRQITVLKLENQSINEDLINEIFGADKSKLIPTHLADMTTDFLVKHFEHIVDYDFTAKAEDSLDLVAEGKVAWQEFIKNFYQDFHPMIEKSAEVSRQEASQARLLGLDPKSQKPIFARFGRYGPMLQLGETESEEKPKFAPLPDNTAIDTVTIDQAIKMFELPRLVGQTKDGKDIKANIGRFGPYIQIDNIYVSIKPLSPTEISIEQALEFYDKKIESDANKVISEFDGGIVVLNGPYGPYISNGTKNVRIPKGVNPKKLTISDCIELIKNAPAKKRFRKK